MDPDATYKLMVDPASDLDEAAVAATDLLVWLACGGFMPTNVPRHVQTRSMLTDECKLHIFRALDRLAELEET